MRVNADDLPRSAPANAVQRMYAVGKVSGQRILDTLPAESTLRYAIGIGYQGIAGGTPHRAARQGFSRGGTQNRLGGASQ